MITDIQKFERQWIETIQTALKSPILDLFFQGWNLVDSFGFMTLLITIVWYMIGKREGIRLFYIIILSVTINTALKHIFTLPRPCQVTPAIGLLCPTSYGMPSGAAQSAVLLSSILYIESRSKTWKATAIIFGTLLCFSRIYLGVHYISDVIVGAFIGALLATVYYKLLPLFERKGKKFILAFPLLLFLIGGPFALLFVSFTLGMQLGLIANADKNRTPLSKNLRLLETAIVLIGLFTLAGFAMKAPALQLIFGLVMGTWLSYLGPQTFAFIAKKSGKVI